jgi:hypothetical protein
MVYEIVSNGSTVITTFIEPPHQSLRRAPLRPASAPLLPRQGRWDSWEAIGSWEFYWYFMGISWDYININIIYNI